MIKSSKLIYWLLGLALVTATFLRLYKNADLLIVKSDVGEDALPVWELMHQGRLIITGPPTSLGPQLPTGPLYYYLLAPIYNLSNWDPARVSLIFKILSLSNIIFFYLVISRFFGRRAGVIASFFDAVLFQAMSTYRWLSNPMPLMVFGLIFTWSVLEIIARPKQKNWWIVAYLTAGLSLHLESASALWYLPILLILTVWRRQFWPGVKTYTLALLAFGLTLVPQLIFEITSRGAMTKTLFQYLFVNQAFAINNANFGQPITTLLRVWNFWLLSTTGIVYIWVPLAIILTLTIIVANKKLQPYFQLLWLFILVPTIGFSFYRFEFLDYYLVGFYPALIILVSVLLSRLAVKTGVFAKLIAVGIFLFIIAINAGEAIKFLRHSENPFFEISYRQQLKAIDWIINQAAGSSFTVKAYRPNPHQPWTTQVDEYFYLTKWQASRHCPRLTCSFVEDATDAEAVFLLYEDDSIHPEARMAWLNHNQPVGELVNKTWLDGITVEHRVKDGSVQGFQLMLQPFRDKLEVDGLEATYIHYQEVYYSLDPGSRHYVGHFLGEEAYRLKGAEGITVCDASFDYGCLHGFILSGVRIDGKAFMEQAYNRCQDFSNERERGACTHGVSHILLYLKGYSFNDLTSSLTECDTYFADDYPQNCHSAIFMEFNLHSAGNDETGELVTARELDDHGLLYPCQDLPAQYQYACFSEQGSWWSYALNLSQETVDSDFIKMAGLCNQVTSVEGRDGCFWGVGRIMADIYQYDPVKIIKTCSLMADDNAVFSCINGALIVSVDNRIVNAYSLCSAVVAARKAECAAAATHMERPGDQFDRYEF